MATPKQIDLDDFTVDGIEVDKLSAEERAIYDRLNTQFRTAYLKKTSGLADERKQFQAAQQEASAIQKDLQEALEEKKRWTEWWQAEGQYMTPRQQQTAMRAEGLEDPNALQQEINVLRNELQGAARQYGTMLQEMQQKTGTLEQAMRLQNDMWELRFKHRAQEDFDPMRVLETAKTKGLSNLELAYNLTYGDDIKKREVDTEVERRMTELKDKETSEKAIVDSKPSTMRYAPPAEPKTYAQAGESMLASLRSSDAKGTIE